MMTSVHKRSPMLISEAMVMLSSYGVERIERISNPHCVQTWKVTQNGGEYIYVCPLDRLVYALEVANDWEG
jgi:hypothetical protein